MHQPEIFGNTKYITGKAPLNHQTPVCKNFFGKGDDAVVKNHGRIIGMTVLFNDISGDFGQQLLVFDDHSDGFLSFSRGASQQIGYGRMVCGHYLGIGCRKVQKRYFMKANVVKKMVY